LKGVEDMSRSRELFHFCAAMDVESIKRQGLTLGMCPVDTKRGIRMIKKCQWLTVNSDPSKQTWQQAMGLIIAEQLIGYA